MKLLVSWMRELGTYVSREFHFTMRDLVRTHQWRHIEPWVLAQSDMPVKARLLATFGEIPEVILFWEAYELFNTIQPALRDLGCRLMLFADDLHSLWGQESLREVRLRAFRDCDLVLASYGYTFHEFYPELAGKKVVWTPHSASPDFALEFNPECCNAILLSGFIGSLYPLRMRMKALQELGGCAIIRHEHPGYREGYDYQNDERVGPGYARTIGRCLAGFTDALTYRYVVAKYFEIPATGALLVADGAVSGPLKELGFIDDVHYVPVSEENLEDRITYVLEKRNREEIDAIRRTGQQLVRALHTTSDRARLIESSCT